MRNVKLVLEYDGTNYVGWQRQANGRSIQGEIEAALHQILRESVSVIGAGRTDAGVHARGQVANFRTTSSRDCDKIYRGANALLPEEIAMLNVEDVPLAFHARYSAKERHYSYLITRSPTAVLRHYSWHVKYPLDVDLMHHAAEMIVGSHDFRSYSRPVAGVEQYRCTITFAFWEVDGSLLRFRIGANRFMRGMVRALVGTMVDVGRGHISLNEFGKILPQRDRSRGGMSAPARGLVLERVLY